MSDADFEEIWKPVKSVMEYLQMEYDEAVTIGGQFGKLKSEIKRLEKELQVYKDIVNSCKCDEYESI